MSSTHYPSFYSHHYEKCVGDEEDHEVLENRLIQACFIKFHFCFIALIIITTFLFPFSANEQYTKPKDGTCSGTPR